MKPFRNVLIRIVPEFAKGGFRKLFWQWLLPRYELHSGISINLSTYSDWYIYNEIFVDRDYDSAIEMVLNNTEQHSIRVLDLGANVGFFTLRLVDQLRVKSPQPDFKIIAVEGNPRTARELQNRIKINNLPNEVEVVHGLIGKKSGTALISNLEFSGQNTVSTVAQSGSSVAYVDLSELVQDIVTIDLIKCDIEGSELSFIESYPDILKKTKSAIFELHPTLCDTERCKTMLTALGFNRFSQVMKKDAVEVVLFWRA